MTAKDSETNKTSKSDYSWIGWLIPLASILGYTMAYVYELAFCNFFQIPTGLIQIEWTKILTAFATTIPGFLIFFWLFTNIFLVGQEKPTHDKKKLISLVIYIIFIAVLAGFFFSMQYLTVAESLWFIASIVFLSIFVFVYPLFMKKKVNQDYLNRFPVHYEQEQKKVPIPHSVNKFISYGFIIITIAMFMIGIFSLAGRAEAMQLNQFYIPSTKSDTVVLRIYGQNCICAHIIPSNSGYQIVEKSYFLLNLGNTANLTLNLMDTGYLRLLHANSSIVIGKIISIGSISSNLDEIILEVLGSKDIPDYENNTKNRVGQQISIRTFERTRQLQLQNGQLISIRIKSEIEEGKEIFYSSGSIRKEAEVK